MKSEQETSSFHGHSCEEMESKSETSDRSSSPAISQVSVRTDQSMDQPVKFKGQADTPISEKPTRSSSPGISEGSVRTDQSMDQPAKFKGQADTSISESIMRLLAEDQFKCSLCNEVFHDPVDTPCGHCYCKLCLTSHWTEPTEEGDYKCPQCSQAYSTRPELYSNGVVKKMLERARYSPVLPASAYARPGEVACDFCTGRKLRAVKFCLTCIAASCENHIKEHYKYPVLLKHQLLDASDSKELEKHLCLKHCKALDVFCKTDQSHICSLCALLEHRSHDIEIADSEQKTSMLPSNPETSLDSDDFYRSPVAGSTFPQMMTPPTGASRCSSRDSDPRIPLKRRTDNPNSPKNVKISRRLQFDDDQEEAETGRSSSVSSLTEKLVEMQCGNPPKTHIGF